MAILKCFYVMNGRKVGREKSSKESFDTLLGKLQHSVSSGTRDSEQNTFDLTVNNGFRKNSRSNVRVMSLENPVKGEVREAYEGGDKNENSLSIKRELSDFDLQFDEPVASKKGYAPTGKTQATDEFEDQSDRYSQKSTDTNHSGHVSDPGIGKTDYLGSPKLK
ncbi:leucine-rich repeat-containing protein, partial [Trifolium medium]|nr:leucine-rich repeat-containing protein [Trifolium medium]